MKGGEQATNRKPSAGGMAQEAKAWRNGKDTLTCARSKGW